MAYCFIHCSLRNSVSQFLIMHDSNVIVCNQKEPEKLMQQVKIAHSFLESVSNQFHVIILSLPLSKNFSKLISKNGEISRFDWSLLMESF